MTTIIPYGRQAITQEDIDAVLEILQSDWLTQGPTIQTFEKAVAHYCKANYGVAVVNATAALHLACLVLEVGKGDYVWTSANTFLASANCARYCGAEVDFVDICPKTYNMSLAALTQKLQQAAKQNKLPKVVIPVHFAGQSCDMKAINELARQYGFKVIEDASHAIGGRYFDEPIGNCRYSDITVFSFHPVKVITTGEGGLLLTNQKHLAEKASLLRSHGMTRDGSLMTQLSEGSWYYQQIDLGFNYRITDMQCALGLSQLRRLDEFVQRRHRLVESYNEKLKDLPLILPHVNPACYSAFHLYVVQLAPWKTTKTRREVFDYLRAAHIGVNVHYIPVHLQPYYRRLGFEPGNFPTAEAYYEQAITLPLYPNLSLTQQEYIVETLQRGLL